MSSFLDLQNELNNIFTDAIYSANQKNAQNKAISYSTYLFTGPNLFLLN